MAGINGDIRQIYYFMPRLETLDIRPDPSQQLFLMEGLPTKSWVDDTFRKENKHCLIIVDDLWAQVVNCPVAEYLNSYGRRHFNVSLVYTGQNFYEKGKYAITIR